MDQLKRLVKTPHDAYLIECGSKPERSLPEADVNYYDPQFETGKAWCHNLIYQYASLKHDYSYLFLMMNDLVFDETLGDPLKELLAQMDSDPQMGLLSPTNFGVGSIMPGAAPRFFPQVSKQRWRKVAVVDYLGFLLRSSAVREAGFLNPLFRWCWGTEYELAYNFYSKGYFLAYTDTVRWRHLGGTTQAVANVSSGVGHRTQYQRRAALFAHVYLRRKYGFNWNDVFWAATKAHRDNFSPNLNAYLQWTTSHRNMFDPLQEVIPSMVLAKATGKVIGMLVAVEDDIRLISTRVKWLCGSVWKSANLGNDYYHHERLECVEGLTVEMVEARAKITKMIGPHLQAAAEMAMASARLYEAQGSDELYSGPHQLPGMTELTAMLVEARIDKLSTGPAGLPSREL